MRLPFRTSGTAPSATACASPSTTADLPTPASPTSTGLFLVLRQSICITRAISLSLPTTGSSLPCSAFSVRSKPSFDSAEGTVPSSSPSAGAYTDTSSRPSSSRRNSAPALSKRPKSVCSLRGARPDGSPIRTPIASSSTSERSAVSTPRFSSIATATPSRSCRSAARMCSVPISPESVQAAMSAAVSTHLFARDEKRTLSRQLRHGIIAAMSRGDMSSRLSTSAAAPVSATPTSRCSVPRIPPVLDAQSTATRNA